MTHGIRGGAGTSAYYTQSQPFDELKLDQGQIQEKTEKLKEKGYFTVPMSETTRNYLHEQSSLSNPAWREGTVGKVVDLRSSDYERSITTVAKNIATKLTGTERELRPQEFQLRRAKNQGADQWHQDKEPKKVICIATVEGRGTEFVKPRDSEGIFRAGIYGQMVPLNADAIERRTKEAKLDRFYFFAGKGISEDEVPKLVHRSPHESDRSIFLARWK
ncbi:type III effector HopAZ1 [Pseudomonas syringae group genomosp. 3]|uniref:type III effector HopAZ1 n=1 Tax=Pseudomonas syringae group genomosp. 3 TaxID=251701 RepID=UPI0007098506|nr:type III effector HopAZ1 [Pseudomonas syringae group genomosp. 3]